MGGAAECQIASKLYLKYEAGSDSETKIFESVKKIRHNTPPGYLHSKCHRATANSTSQSDSCKQKVEKRGSVKDAMGKTTITA